VPYQLNGSEVNGGWQAPGWRHEDSSGAKPDIGRVQLAHFSRKLRPVTVKLPACLKPFPLTSFNCGFGSAAARAGLSQAEQTARYAETVSKPLKDI
jgi:hypothetical protein